jgi:hypothetical protein
MTDTGGDVVYEFFKSDPIGFMYTFVPPPPELLCTIPRFHIDICNAAETNEHLAVAAPRGSAKSTILAFLKPLHSVLFKRKRFILLISNTFTKAILTLQSMKIAVQKNRKIIDFFPNITLAKDSEGDTEFVHPDGYTTKVLCRGVDQLGATRGVKFGDYRPDLIIGDDMEDDELVRSPERRLQLQSDFDDALIPTGDRNTQYIFIGTILHDDSQLAKLVSEKNYPEYHKLVYRARNEVGGVVTSLWPEKWSVEQLNKMEKEKPTTFAKEMQNDPVAGANQRFKKENFRVWRQEGSDYILTNEFGEYTVRGSMANCVPAIACDLAWKEKRESDSCAILPGYLTPNSEILIEDYIHEKGLKPNDIAEHLFVMADRMQKLTGMSPAIGFEKAMLENVTKWFLKQEMRRRNKFLVTKELVWDADKITRIETRLIPRYAQHVIYHKRGMGDLEYQLERFPYGAHDDLPDAEQGLVQLLQFPRSFKKAEAVDDEFEWWRKQAIEAKKAPTHGFNGTKYQVVGLPTRKSWR